MGVWSESFEDAVDLAEAGAFDDAFFVGDPFAAAGEDRVGGFAGGLADGAGGFGEVAVFGVGFARVAEGELGHLPPGFGGGGAEGFGVFGGGEVAAEGAFGAEFGDDEVAGDGGEVEGEVFDVEASLAGFGEVVFDVVEVAVVHVDVSSVDFEPGAAVEDAAAPAADG